MQPTVNRHVLNCTLTSYFLGPNLTHSLEIGLYFSHTKLFYVAYLGPIFSALDAN